jgi:hypothetical protein
MPQHRVTRVPDVPAPFYFLITAQSPGGAVWEQGFSVVFFEVATAIEERPLLDD